MKNETVIKEFLKRKQAKTENLKTDGTKLVNYNTIIAYFNQDVLFINSRKYSVTTSKIQSMIKREVQGIEIQEYHGSFNDCYEF